MPEAKLAERQDVADLAFLGREFMTWLLWRIDRGEDSFDAPDGSFSIVVGGRARFKGLSGDATDAVLKGGSAALSAPARAAMGCGRTLREAELRVVRGEREWRCTLDSDTLDLRGVKLPALLTEEEDDRFLERMSLVEELDGLVKTAFAEFLRDRTRPVWQRSTIPSMRDWLAESLRPVG